MREVVQILCGEDDCPASVEALNEYLDLEDYDRQRSTLEYFFKAFVEGNTAWVWKYLDNKAVLNYAVVSQTQYSERPDIYEIGCGPAQDPTQTPADIVAMLKRANYF